MKKSAAVLLAAALLVPSLASAQALDQLATQAAAAGAVPAGTTSDAPAPAAAPVYPIYYVQNDGVLVYPDERGEADPKTYPPVAELRAGEAVKLLAQDKGNTGWFFVEVNRRQYDDKTGWTNVQGWIHAVVPASPSTVTAAAAPAQTFLSQTQTPNPTIPLQFDALKPSDCREKFIDQLKTFVGVPYKWGGTSHAGVDCSGMVVAALLQSNCVREAPPRTAADQQKASTKLSAEQLQPGDLIFKGDPAHHVFVYLGTDASGNRQVIEAMMTGTNVFIHSWRPSNENFGSLLPRLEQGR